MKLGQRLFAADFETVTYPGIKETEVWSAAVAELYHDELHVWTNIDEFYGFMAGLRCNATVWFHNLRFDGSFIFNFILRRGWKFASDLKDKPAYYFSALISPEQRYYNIVLKFPSHRVEIRDSLKLLPFSLEAVGKAFDTAHKKLEMEYEGRRKAYGAITDEERAYIENDVLCLKEALEVMLSDGYTKLTIGSCCVSQYKEMARMDMGVMGDYEQMFVNLKNISLPAQAGSATVHDYIQKGYRGGWTYLKPEYAGTHVWKHGVTFDVNSLYPSVMHSASGNYYPVGSPHMFYGGIPEICSRPDVCYYVRVRCRFKLKAGYLPTVQIKRDLRYRSTEWLTTSDFYYRGKYVRYLTEKDGTVREAKPVLTLYMTDYKLLLEHYNVEDLEILDCCWFYGMKGIFDAYIDHFMAIKQNNKGVKRTEAKLFLNNLYGKLASSDDSSYLEPMLLDDGSLGYECHAEREREVWCIAKGAAVTAYARYFTITHAQDNYAQFIYADTDSLHMLDNGSYVGIEEHPSNLLCWKRESDWSSAIFIRQKTYAEFVRKEDGKKCVPHWDLKCAGMPDRCKRAFFETHPITDFCYGLSVHGKLIPKQIPGGVVLVETDYTLRKHG